jgi:hypothetical protein
MRLWENGPLHIDQRKGAHLSPFSFDLQIQLTISLLLTLHLLPLGD